jgi:hypothetical protein
MNIKKMVLEGVSKLKGMPSYNKIKAGAKNTDDSHAPLGDMDQNYSRLFKDGGAATIKNKIGTTCHSYSHGGKASKAKCKTKKKK